MLVLGLALGDATAAPSLHGPQAGSVVCTTLTGTMKFDPPLTSAGTSPEVAPLRLVISGCTASGGATPKEGHGSAAIPLHTNNCSSLTSRSKSPITLAIRWSPTTDETSEVRLAEFAPTKTAAIGFRLGGSKTTVNGSYPGSNHGASSRATLVSSTSPSKLASACASTKGLEVLKIVGSSLELK